MKQARTRRAQHLAVAFFVMPPLLLAALVLLAVWTPTGRGGQAAMDENAMSTRFASSVVPLSLPAAEQVATDSPSRSPMASLVVGIIRLCAPQSPNIAAEGRD